MSVAVSAGLAGAGEGGGGGEMSEMCGWRQEVRAKVTALKCHVMASRGLTSDGHIVAPYSPHLLLDAANLDLEAYAEALQNGGLLGTPKEPAQPDPTPPDPGPTPEPAAQLSNSVSINDVHLRLKETPTHSPQQETSAHDSPTKGAQLPPLASQQSPQPSPGPSPQSSPMKQEPSSPSNSRAESEMNGEVIGEIEVVEEDEVESKNGEVEGEGESEELARVKRELRAAEAEVERLSNIRDEVEAELQDLTATLFQEAHSMVNSANQRAANAEKSLREAEMQVEVLTAEVTALKALVITSTPAAPNPHLHPQLITKSVTETGKKIFQRGHRKSPSDFDLRYGRDTTPPSSPLKESRINDAGALAQFPLDPECWEVDPVVHKEFIMWKQNPTLDRSDPFMQRIYEEDIDLCLAFPNSILAHRVQRAIEDNSVFIEEVNPRQKSSCPRVDPDETRKCVLLDVPRFCKYRFRLGESDDTWYYISQLARNRIIAICDFLNYLRYIKLGLVKSSVHDVYWEIVKLRRQMALARLGF